MSLFLSVYFEDIIEIVCGKIKLKCKPFISTSRVNKKNLKILLQLQMELTSLYSNAQRGYYFDFYNNKIFIHDLRPAK